MGSINQIIVSCNEDPKYFTFWKYVAKAYKKMFPDVRVHLAFLTWRSEDDEVVKEMRTHGDVTLFKPLSWLPEFGQAKMIRFLLASEQGDDVCYIDDIDLIPLSRNFITEKTDSRPANYLLCVGGEVYGNNGCFPVSQMTAEGHIFKRIFNPKDLDYENLMEWYQFTPTKFDFREEIGIINNFPQDRYFSDERLIKRLRAENPVPFKEVERGYGNFLDATLDRFEWRLNQDKLDNNGYVNAHCSRPARESEIEPLMKYLDEKYS
jgi:hypothetical protein